jgi:DNA polymerase-3 subunit beta
MTGEDMEIGFKSTFLIEILANLASIDVIMEMSDPYPGRNSASKRN